MFYCVISLILFLCLIAYYLIRKRKEIIEGFVETDVEMSIFERIPDKLNRYSIGITMAQYALSIFVINKKKTDNPIVGYILDSDLHYLNSYQNIFNFQTKRLTSINAYDISKDCNLFFMKTSINAAIFKDFNNRYGIYKLDLPTSHTQFWFPFSKTIKINNTFENKLVDVICIPNIIINSKNLSIDREKSRIFNIHIGLEDSQRFTAPETPPTTSFTHVWWTKELSDQASKINFQLIKYDFKHVKNIKKLKIYDDVTTIVGDRILLTGQYDESMNDYYYVVSNDPITLKTYLDQKILSEFSLMNSDRMLMTNKISVYIDGIFVDESTPLKKSKSYYDCVNKVDYSVDTSFLTKEACESDFDVYGNKRTIDTMWFKRCKNNYECEYYNKGNNRLRGGCVNGLCDKPLMSKDSILYYGSNPDDYAYSNDVYDRIKQDLRPILNL